MISKNSSNIICEGRYIIRKENGASAVPLKGIMNFKEFYEFESECELFRECDAIDENWLTSPLKFAAGTVGNLATQAVKGVGNVAGGLGRMGLGAAQTGLGALQVAGGGAKTGSENIRGGISRVAGGVGQGLKGATQFVASPATALLRGAQASAEDFTTPMSQNRNWMQKTLGLNRWSPDPESPVQSPVQSASKPSVQSASGKQWQDLVKAYNNTQNPDERAGIQRELKKMDPARYAQAKEKANQMKLAQRQGQLQSV